MEQGRIAALHAFGEPVETLPELVPTGVYAIPEIAMVGRTEEQLTDAAVPYVAGVARWSELARGLMTGDEDGMLKLLVSPTDRRLLGVHVIGTGATDLVHIGQAVMGGSVDDRLPRHRGLQLPDVRRVLQGRGARREQPHQGDGVGRRLASGRRSPGVSALVASAAASAAAFAASAASAAAASLASRSSARDFGRFGGARPRTAPSGCRAPA